MITLSRNVARQIAVLFRRALGLSVAQCSNQLVLLTADEHGLQIKSDSGKSAVVFHDPTVRPHCTLQAPLEMFKTIGGSKNGLITLTAIAGDKIQANWLDGAVPRTGTWSSRTDSENHDFPPHQRSTRRILRSSSLRFAKPSLRPMPIPRDSP